MADNFKFTDYIKNNPLLNENTNAEAATPKGNTAYSQMLDQVDEMTYASMKANFNKLVKAWVSNGWTRQDITGLFGSLVDQQMGNPQGTLKPEKP